LGNEGRIYRGAIRRGLGGDRRALIQAAITKVKREGKNEYIQVVSRECSHRGIAKIKK